VTSENSEVALTGGQGAGGCETRGMRMFVDRGDDGMEKRVWLPCDVTRLQSAAALDRATFDAAFPALGEARVLAQSPGLAAQPFAGLSAPRARSILGLTRYNRVEGISSGVGFDQSLGDGYIWNAVLRAGTADRRLSGDMRVGRTNSISTWHLAGYSTIA